MPNKQELLDVVADLSAAVDLWRKDAGPTRQWMGAEAKVVSRAVEIEAETLFNFIDTCDFAKDCWAIVLAADLFHTEWASWSRIVETAPDEVHPAGTTRMWEYLEVLQASTMAPQEARLEDPEVLIKMAGMSYRQMAKMYGWYYTAPGGEKVPDQNRAIELLANPEKLAEWRKNPPRSPAAIQREAEISSQWEKRRFEYDSQKRQETERESRLEPLIDLVVLDGMSVKTLRKIRPDATDDQILEACETMGVKLPDVAVVSPRAASPTDRLRQREQEQADAEKSQAEIDGARTRVTATDLEERIFALTAENLKPAQISELFHQEGKTVSPQAIGRLIQKRRREGETSKT